jgi:putative ATP-binding cassette transporter
MYALLKELPDTSFISVGHRVSLLSYHDEVLRLEGDTTWRVLEAGRYKEEIATMREV